MTNDISGTAATRVARAGFMFCGVLGIVQSAFQLLPSLAMQFTFAIQNYRPSILPPMIVTAVAPVLMLVMCWYLIAKSDILASRLFPDDVVGSSQIERALYRVILTSIGVVILANALPSFIAGMGFNFIQFTGSDIWPAGLYNQLSLQNIPAFAVFLIQLFIGLYLIVGAPKFVRWQVSRSEIAG